MPSTVAPAGISEPLRLRYRHAYPGFALAVDLRLPGQGITALFGPSGSGKTTLLRLIAGLERPASGFFAFGDAVWQDEQHFLPAHRRPVGYVFQDARLFPHLTVRGNLDYGRKRAGAADRGTAIVALLGLGGLLERRPERLSGGEAQRVAIARALLTEPSVLLMDEPLAALDAACKAEFLLYLERLHAELEIPVFYVSHDAGEVARLADYAVVLEDGRVAAEGPPSHITSHLSDFTPPPAPYL